MKVMTHYNEGLTDRELILSTKELSEMVGCKINIFPFTGKIMTLRYFLYNQFSKLCYEGYRKRFNNSKFINEIALYTYFIETSFTYKGE